MKRLPDTELEVMKALWKSGADTPRTVLEQALEHFGWASNTVNTYLTRLEKKAFVSVTHDRKGNRYTALISKEEYQAFDSKAVLSQLYGTPRSFVAALARTGLERSDLEQLRSLLDELEEQDHE